MREFRYYVETEPGLIERRETAAYYRREMQRQAPLMVQHFGRVWARPELAELRAHRYETVIAFGGGHPHFEVQLNAGAIRVVDQLAETYEQCRDVFDALYPDAPPVVFSDPAVQTFRPGPGELISYCHVLEHFTVAAAAAEIAEAAARGADILIYGPNADRMQTDGWLHARPVHEHLYLPGLSWQAPWAERVTGRKARIAIAHDEDLLIWLPAPAAAKPKRVRKSRAKAAKPREVAAK